MLCKPFPALVLSYQTTDQWEGEKSKHDKESLWRRSQSNIVSRVDDMNNSRTSCQCRGKWHTSTLLRYDALCDWYLHLPSEQNKDCFLSLQLPNGPLTDFTNIETDIQQWNVKCGEKCKNCSSCHVYTSPTCCCWLSWMYSQTGL